MRLGGGGSVGAVQSGGDLVGGVRGPFAAAVAGIAGTTAITAKGVGGGLLGRCSRRGWGRRRPAAASLLGAVANDAQEVARARIVTEQARELVALRPLLLLLRR